MHAYGMALGIQPLEVANKQAMPLEINQSADLFSWRLLYGHAHHACPCVVVPTTTTACMHACMAGGSDLSCSCMHIHTWVTSTYVCRACVHAAERGKKDMSVHSTRKARYIVPNDHMDGRSLFVIPLHYYNTTLLLLQSCSEPMID